MSVWGRKERKGEGNGMEWEKPTKEKVRCTMGTKVSSVINGMLV